MKPTEQVKEIVRSIAGRMATKPSRQGLRYAERRAVKGMLRRNLIEYRAEDFRKLIKRQTGQDVIKADARNEVLSRLGFSPYSRR